MKTFLVAIIIGVSAGFSQAEDAPQKFEKLETKSGKVYSGVTVREKTAASIKIFHSAGAATIPFEELPEDVVEALGGFDEGEAAKERAKQEEARKAAYERDRMAARAEANKQERFGTLLEMIKKYKALGESMQKGDRDRAAKMLPIYEGLYEIMQRYPSESNATVVSWTDAVLNNKVLVGMPQELVILSWGKPHKINQDSNFPDQWIYRRAGFSAQMLYMQNGRVKSFNEY